MYPLDDNTGPYRKLIPALREAEPDDLIVTADDDIFSGRDWLQGLIKAYVQPRGFPRPPGSVIQERISLRS